MRGGSPVLSRVFGLSSRQPARAFSSATQCVSCPCGSGRVTILLPGFWPEDGQEAVAAEAAIRGHCPLAAGPPTRGKHGGSTRRRPGSAAAGTGLALRFRRGPRGRAGGVDDADEAGVRRGGGARGGVRRGVREPARPRRSQASRSSRCSPRRGRLRSPARVPPIVPGARRPSAPSCRSPRPRPCTGVNLWLDGWSGSRRCLYSQHDSPADGFTLAGGQPATVGFHQAAIECAPPFTIDRIDARVRSGDTLVYQGSWSVSLSFVE